jgi:hypothetical protein
MYKILGADGKEYGPVTVERLGQWLVQGRINGQTQIQVTGSAEWRPAAQLPELASLFAPPSLPPAKAVPPPVLRPPKALAKSQGLAVVSFVLSVVSFVLCLSALTGIPAIICGHIARRRAARLPERYAGAGFAMAGIVLGYASILFSLVIGALLLPALSQARRAAQWQRQTYRSDCENNLQQTGLSFKVWSLEHGDRFPFNVSTNSGGTLELCRPGPDGFDNNAIAHFLAVSKELSTPNFLVCPKDHSKHAASSFEDIGPNNITYQLRTGTNINGENPQEVLVVCPVDGNTLYCDGNVRKARGPR